MLTATRIVEEVDGYRGRVNELYDDVRRWVSARRPDAIFSQSDVELNEEAIGPYKIHSLEVSLPGLAAVRFVPRGRYMIGTRGRVDAQSRFGHEVLAWVDVGGPDPKSPENLEEELELISRPTYPNVPKGWAWSDWRKNQLLPLTAETLWDQVLTRLTLTQ